MPPIRAADPKDIRLPFHPPLREVCILSFPPQPLSVEFTFVIHATMVARRADKLPTRRAPGQLLGILSFHLAFHAADL